MGFSLIWIRHLPKLNCVVGPILNLLVVEGCNYSPSSHNKNQKIIYFLAMYFVFV